MAEITPEKLRELADEGTLMTVEEVEPALRAAADEIEKLRAAVKEET